MNAPAGRGRDERPRVGFLCPYVPEELIHAAGLLPFRLVPSNGTLTTADGFLPASTCSYLRYVTEKLTGEPAVNLAGLVINHSCDASRRCFDLFGRYTGTNLFFLDTPRRTDRLSEEYLRQQYLKMARWLEGLSHWNITTGRLRSSIRLFGRIGRLLSGLYDLHGLRPHLLEAGDLARLMEQVTTMPREQAAVLLERRLRDAGEAAGPEKAGPQECVQEGKRERPGAQNELGVQDEEQSMRVEPGGAGEAGPCPPRVFVSGNVFDPLPLFEAVRDAGGVVAGNDFCFGGRYRTGEVAAGCEPFEALARYALRRVGCGRMENYRDRFDFILDAMRRSGARGLVYATVKFCDSFLVDYALLRERLAGLQVPSLFIEGEYFSLGSGQIRTRVEAFLETLRENA